MVATNARGAAGKKRQTAGSPAQSARIVAFPGVHHSAQSLSESVQAAEESFLIVVDYAQRGVGYFSRLLSVTSAASVAELAEAILVSFQWPETVDALVPTKPLVSNWSLRARRDGVLRVYSREAHSPGTEIGDALVVGSGAVLKVGQSTFTFTVASSVPRGVPVPAAGETVEEWPSYAAFSDPDATTDQPDALLLGADFIPDNEAEGAESGTAGTGDTGYPAKTVDIERVNVELVGEDPVENVLANLKPELAKLLKEYQLFQFIPLLQALDLDRPALVDEQVAEQLADLPVEKTPKARAAAWSRIIALSTLGGEDVVAETSESFMNALFEAMACRKNRTGKDSGRKAVAHFGATGTAVRAAGIGSIRAVTADGEVKDQARITSEEIQHLARPTIKILATAGADSWHPANTSGDSTANGELGEDTCSLLVPRRSIVERLEMYRYILQR